MNGFAWFGTDYAQGTAATERRGCEEIGGEGEDVIGGEAVWWRGG